MSARSLIKTQVNDDTCASGSWDPSNPRPDRWGEAAGRLFQTSLSILTLEVYYRYLPLYRTADTEGLEARCSPQGTRRKTGRKARLRPGRTGAARTLTVRRGVELSNAIFLYRTNWERISPLADLLRHHEGVVSLVDIVMSPRVTRAW